MDSPKFLNRYHAVTNNQLPAQFQIVKSIPTRYDISKSLDELWNIHERSMEQYRSLLDLIDSEKRYPEKLTAACTSLLDLKIAIAEKLIEKCCLCEHRCDVNRKRDEKGFCRLTETSRYTSEFLHMGEESELVPSHTIFFTGCVFGCVYCQNWDISAYPEKGHQVNPANLAAIIRERRHSGARNVNFVTPTPHAHNILKILREVSVNIPVIWNSNMYHTREIAKLLEGVIDVYLTDFKYGSDRCAKKYSKVQNYLEIVKRNHEIAYQKAEIIIRHLVLPEHLECCTKPVVRWIAKHVPEVRFNLMFQYTPQYRSREYPEISRRLLPDEKEKAIAIVKESGIEDILI
ncbi:radical SAM protein [Methanohalophilus mahii]|uniref:Radical SAM domain protein n=1 Tax=Methanohalophilus mahii (strain ATCC 35705 / DSM 5219 / SLP) TaxID=547558 RepID=D5EA01_METMS|nr:radical SAM protein [Methanohalophilus mahii]ADE36002.1 Radical SAM domain protein [Methanohalophilus mahii DSM 5219]